uniref:Ectonucleotide pyrophosphatase/phosphodiesterase 7 n=1 Tax=Junco hyemalis TaxID=40217 RepID=A0A8C5IQ36_JUNHY
RAGPTPAFPLQIPRAALPAGQTASNRSKLLLVSFDGFRWNYDQDVDTPNLDAMAAEGVKAKYMTPAFVTLTSPCHFTLLTGECPAWEPQGPDKGRGREGQRAGGTQNIQSH